MFGNSLQGESQLLNLLLPKLCSLNSLNFDFLECNFSEKLGRESSGRVGIMKACGELPNCYTLECCFASGRRVNHICPKLNLITG